MDRSQSVLERLEPRKAPQQSRSRATVDSIKQATLELAAKDGFADLNTGMIAERAGVSKGSLYQYFPNRDAIFLALFEDATSRLTLSMKGLFGGIVDLPPQIGMPRVMRRHLALVRENRLILLRLGMEIPQLKIATRPIAYETMIARATRTYMHIHCPTLSTREVERRAFFVHEIVQSCINRYVDENPPHLSDRAFIRQLSDILVYTIMDGAKG